MWLSNDDVQGYSPEVSVRSTKYKHHKSIPVVHTQQTSWATTSPMITAIPRMSFGYLDMGKQYFPLKPLRDQPTNEFPPNHRSLIWKPPPHFGNSPSSIYPSIHPSPIIHHLSIHSYIHTLHDTVPPIKQHPRNLNTPLELQLTNIYDV